MDGCKRRHCWDDLSDEREEREVRRRTGRVPVVILALQGSNGRQGGHCRVVGFGRPRRSDERLP